MKETLFYWIKKTFKLYVLSSVMMIGLVCGDFFIGALSGSLNYPFFQMVILVVIFVPVFHSSIITFLFILLRYLRILSEDALRNKLIILVAILLPCVLNFDSLNNYSGIFDSRTVYGHLLPYIVTFLIICIIDKFSLFDKLRIKLNSIAKKARSYQILKSIYMKHMMKIINISMLSFILGCFIAIFTQIIKEEKQQELYKYTGKTSVKELEYKKSKEFGYIPVKAVTESNIGVVPDAETAVKIGMIVLSRELGDDFVNLQKPFNVELLNNQIWYIKGTRYKGNQNVCIAIQKTDGRILYVKFL